MDQSNKFNAFEQSDSNLQEEFQNNRFSRTLSDFWDKRFLRILSGSVSVHIAFVIYFLFNPISDETALKTIDQIQKQLAKTLREREALKEEQYVRFDFKQSNMNTLAKRADVKPKATPKPSGSLKVAKKKVEKALAQNKGGSPDKPARARRRRVSRSSIAANVGKKGVLAVLTSTGSAASGTQVADLLGDSNAMSSDLDKTMSRLSGLKSGGSSGTGFTDGEVRGGREASGGDIDASVSELDGGSSSFERSGELVVASSSPLIEGGDGSGGILGRHQDDIQAVILKHNKSVQHCYERELKRNPNLRGKITIRFTITPRGSVKNVELISSTLGSRTVESCIMSRIRRWNDFGEVETSFGNTTIRQSYAFGY